MSVVCSTLFLLYCSDLKEGSVCDRSLSAPREHTVEEHEHEDEDEDEEHIRVEKRVRGGVVWHKRVCRDVP